MNRIKSTSNPCVKELGDREISQEDNLTVDAYKYSVEIKMINILRRMGIQRLIHSKKISK